MSKGMLGLLPLSEVQGVINDIQQKLSGEEGSVYLAQLKKFARKELCWAPNVVHPTEFTPDTLIGAMARWEDVGTDTDDRSLELTEIDFSKVLFETSIKEGENFITGEEKMRRLIGGSGIYLDPRFGVTLLKEKGQQTLERLYRERDITYFDFFGRILVLQHDCRSVLCLGRRNGEGWNWHTRELTTGWGAGDFTACLAS